MVTATPILTDIMRKETFGTIAGTPWPGYWVGILFNFVIVAISFLFAVFYPKVRTIINTYQRSEMISQMFLTRPCVFQIIMLKLELVFKNIRKSLNKSLRSFWTCVMSFLRSQTTYKLLMVGKCWSQFCIDPFNSDRRHLALRVWFWRHVIHVNCNLNYSQLERTPSKNVCRLRTGQWKALEVNEMAQSGLSRVLKTVSQPTHATFGRLSPLGRILYKNDIS